MKKYEKTMLLFLVAFFVIIGSLIAFHANECTVAKASYEKNPELAHEKYGYDSFEEWRLEGATGEFDSNCVAEIDPMFPMDG